MLLPSEKPKFVLGLHVPKHFIFRLTRLKPKGHSIGRYCTRGQLVASIFNSFVPFIPKNLLLELFVAERFNLTSHTQKFMAMTAFLIGEDVVVVEVEVLADGALEGRNILNVIVSGGLFARRDGEGLVRIVLLEMRIDQRGQFMGSRIHVVPDIAKLRNGSEFRSLQFVDVMVKVVGTCYKFRFLLVVYFQLDLADDGIVEFDVHEDVIGPSPQSVFYLQDLHFLRLVCTYLLYAFEDGQNLGLL